VRGHVTVSLDVVGDRALASVTDQGEGPDPELHGQLFERFWRGPGASERPGSGLGLSIVAAIAAHHHGRVRVDGATFTLDLPLAPGGAGRQAPGRAGRQAPGRR
jgi:signal transduction histidine kinase